MAYTKQTWIDNNLTYPVSADRMNHIEDGIDDVDTRVAGLEASSGGSTAAGGVLSGNYPNPGFAEDMATQAELNSHKTSSDHDGRYYTETETNALLTAKQDAATAATSSDLATHASSGDHDARYYIKSDADSRYVRNAVATAKGDILAATGSGVIARKAVGADGLVLKADSTSADGLAWGTGGGGGLGGLELIAEAVVTGTQTVITFANIPQTFADLKIYGQYKSTVASELIGLRMTVNNSSVANYNHSGYSVGSGDASVAKFAAVNQAAWHLGQVTAASQAAQTWSSLEITLPNYTRAGRPVVHSRMGSGYSGGEIITDMAGRNYGLASPVTRIDIFDANNANIAAGTILRLYGIRSTVGAEPLPVSAAVSKNTNQNIAHASWVKATWEVTNADNAGGVNLTSEEYVVPETGEYLVSAQVPFNNAASWLAVMGVFKSASSPGSFPGDANAIFQVSSGRRDKAQDTIGAARTAWLTKGEILTVWVYHDGSNNPQNVHADTTGLQKRGWLNVTRLHGQSGDSSVPLLTTATELAAYSTAKNGTEVDFQSTAMETDGIIWRFRKNGSWWYCVGGDDWITAPAPQYQTTSTSFVDPNDHGVTVPLAGDYRIQIGSRVTGAGAYMHVFVGPTQTSNSVWIYSQATSTNSQQASRPNRINTIAAGAVLTARHRVDSGATGTFNERWLAAKPLRIAA